MGAPVRRAVLVALACGAALACAGAVAAGVRDEPGFAPRLAVTSSGAGTTTIVYSEQATGAEAAVLELYAPPRDEASLSAAPGTTIGTVAATVTAADLGGARLPLKGTVTAAAPTDTITVGGTDVTLAAAALACTGSPTAAAYWVASVAVPGIAVKLPVFVTEVETGRFAGGLSLKVCPPPPGGAPGTPGRAAFGSKLVELRLTLAHVLTVPAGWQQWYLRAVPYAPGTSQLDPSGAVEAQAQDRSPQELTLTARQTRKAGVVRLSGRLHQGGRGIDGRRVRILVGGQQVGKATTGPGGRFSLTRRVSVPTSFTAAATVRPRDGDCKEPAFAPLPCVSATVGGFVARSKPVRVKPS